VSEGLSVTEVGREVAKHAAEHQHAHDRIISIAEAILLSVVTLLAAYSGYEAAKWSTESHLELTKASVTHTRASQAFQESLTLRSADATTFNAWFGAYLAKDAHGMAVAERRFRPQYRVAFDAWLATKPFTNADAPPGPQSMPQYEPTGETESAALEEEGNAAYTHGEHAGETADDYIRTTVILASVLFLVGISTRFPLRGGRYALVGLGAVLLVISFVLLLQLPGPPT
jgi:hypothetical protein